MKLNKSIGISICMLFGVFSVIFLYSYSKNYRHQKNTFIRLFPSHPLDYIKSQDIEFNSYYLAGVSKQNIYLSNYNNPSRLLVTDYLLKDTQYLQLNILNNKKIVWNAVETIVDSPNLYLAEGYNPIIFYGTLSMKNIIESKVDTNIHFDAFIPISNSSFILRTYSPKLKQNVLAKETSDSPFVKYNLDGLQKQIDGVFCTDGRLHYDPINKMLIYVYYYRNQFICLDSNLHILYKGNTIDTNNLAKIQIAYIKSENKTIMSQPPLTVNRKSCVDNGLLFVNSNLVAKNESISIFEENSVIDIYSLKDGKYLYSFYLPKLYKSQIKDFKVHNNKLIALYDHYIVVFEINPKLLS